MNANEIARAKAEQAENKAKTQVESLNRTIRRAMDNGLGVDELGDLIRIRDQILKTGRPVICDTIRKMVYAI